MDLKDILKIDVFNEKKLVKLGYNPNVYYCGNFAMQKTWTKVRDFLEKNGLKFPFNAACFLHDRAYATKPNMWRKVKIDLKFYNNMMKLLNLHYSKKDKLYGYLRFRARTYFLIVIAMTPLYIFQGKITGVNKQKNG